MKTILCVLQNAWCSPDRVLWTNAREWEVRLWASHTGRRLKRMLPANVRIIPINSTPHIGTSLRDTFPPDLRYIRRHYYKYKPDLVVACGRIAQNGLVKAHIPHYPAPHPAWRQLSIPTEQRIRQEIEVILNG